MKLSDFKYDLPEELIAEYPADQRDESRLMVLDRKEKSIEHKKFKDLVEYLREGDVLVVNKTKVYPARIYANKSRTGAKVELLLLRELSENLWEVSVKPARKVRIGNKLEITEDVVGDVVDNTVSGGRVVRFKDVSQEELYKIIDEEGECPLPPYIDREPEKKDKERYQTVFAEERGAVAAPTAGLHFTDELMEQLDKKGVLIKDIILHIGLGTFKPVNVEDLSRHRMDSEYYELGPETAEALNKAKDENRRVVAVGTSVVRTLETVTVAGFNVAPSKGWTDEFIYPPYEFKMVDALITNFHQPESTLLMLASAFAGHEFLMESYQEAIDKEYRFFSYGDAMFIK
jgi:S-adenosylmethionine:tRNA ribosyltransferase-isomerase